jgi:esterase/lipase superfamily enzyme
VARTLTALVVPLIAIVALAQPPVSVTLSRIASPSTGAPGVTTVNLTGSNFPDGTILPTSITITLKSAAQDATVTAKATAITSLLGSTRRVSFTIPATVIVPAPTAYRVSLSGRTSANAAFESSNTTLLTVNPGARLMVLNPATAQVGQTLTVAITGSFTNFVNGATKADFGPNVTVNSITITDATHGSAHITIPSAAIEGTRAVTMTTGDEAATLLNGFTLTAPVPNITGFAQPCPQCGRDELSTAVELPIEPSGYVQVTSPICASVVRAQAQQVAALVSSREMRGDDPEALAAGTNRQPQIVGPRDSATASCRNFFAILPPGSQVTRVVLSGANPFGGQSVCGDDRAPIPTRTGWRDCHIGWSGFEGPVIQQFPTSVLVSATFLNWSSNLSRQGVLQVFFKPAKNYLLRENSALPVEVLYATTRMSSGSGYFDANRGGKISLGKCVVTIPPNHRKGDLESPSWWRLQFSSDPERDVVLKSAHPMSEDAFYLALRNSAAGNEALVFIHGYNTTFVDAVRRTGQIKYDLSFDGPAVAFSWPSLGNPAAYTVDETNAEWSVPLLGIFLRSLAAHLGTTKIFLVAHSMGSRVLMNALSRLNDRQAVANTFGRIILAAPDIDRDTFVNLASELKKQRDHLTLYASSHDNALFASKRVHGNPRAGDTATGVTIADGVDTIDVSSVDTSLIGHSYYGDNRSIISDLYYLIRGVPLPRFGLRPATFNGHQYWLFQP